MRNYWMILMMVATSTSLAVAAPGETRVAKWRDDCTAVFLLMFDDGWPSHWQVAIPEMEKRGLIGTFYINPEKGEYKKFEEKWIKEIPESGMVIGNHTMTHQGVRDMEHAEYEVGECADYIRKNYGKDKPGLVSYGQPGVGDGKWNITQEQLGELLGKHHLIERPPFRDHGAVYHLQTADQMMALVEKAIEERGMEYLVIHGVERKEPDWGYQDFWALKQDVFFPLLDRLKEQSDKGQLWITDHITQHKYEVQRKATGVVVEHVTTDEILLRVTNSADPRWYDGSLTFITEVAADWGKAVILQGDTRSIVAAKDGLVKFEAFPGVVRLNRQ